MTLSYATGIAVSRGFSPWLIAGFVSLALYINSKQALSLWIRGTGPGKGPAAVFITQISGATIILLLIISRDLMEFLPYAVVPAAYMLLLLSAGEHALATEISGFVLLSMSAVVSRYILSDEIDPYLALAVAVFFSAGVFKVRLKLRRGFSERALMVLYVVFSFIVYGLIGAPRGALLPLADNFIFAVTLYKVKLRTTGWIEVAKGTAFVALIAFYQARNGAVPDLFR